MQYAQVPDGWSTDSDDAVRTAKYIEQRTDVHIEIDGRAGTAAIESSDALEERRAAAALRAFRFGFSRDAIGRLLEEERSRLETVDLRQHTKNHRELRRQKGRIIGRNGRTRELFEELTGASVVVHDKRVSAIGTYEEVLAVRQAVLMLLDGRSHGRVYAFMEQCDTDGVVGLV